MSEKILFSLVDNTHIINFRLKVANFYPESDMGKFGWLEICSGFLKIFQKIYPVSHMAKKNLLPISIQKEIRPQRDFQGSCF